MDIEKVESACPLCLSAAVAQFFEDRKRAYWRCSDCQLVFVPPRYWLNAIEEKTVYDQHENNVQDPGYRKFLSRLMTPLLERLAAKQKGLDFGCGAGPALAVMLEELGHQVDLFDPFYANNPAVFQRRYDFICATEVAEHLQDPQKEFTRLFNLLKPDGWLGLMTKLANDDQDFSQWHYIRDPTHICFYSRRTFEYLAEHFRAELTFFGNDVILLKKN